MIEKCPKCEAEFSVAVLGGGGICGACLEPIECPYCHKTVTEERTTGSFIETLIKAPDSKLARYLGISDVEWEEMGVELNENYGNSGDMIYCYWFTVPKDTTEEVLDKTGWRIDQIIDDIPVSLMDD
ncbi:hypothetical protein N8878_01495 [Psychromonas sp.]|nr:hypothetical protein [Psychromonas sp.]